MIHLALQINVIRNEKRYRPHNDHLQILTDHILTTHRPRTNHIPTTYRQFNLFTITHKTGAWLAVSHEGIPQHTTHHILHLSYKPQLLSLGPPPHLGHFCTYHLEKMMGQFLITGFCYPGEMRLNAIYDCKTLQASGFPRWPGDQIQWALLVAEQYLQRCLLVCSAALPPTSPQGTKYCSSVTLLNGGLLHRLAVVTTASGDGFPLDCLLQHAPPLS